MKFDVVLIGGGLSSLVCGIKLQKAGKKCLMVSAGQNALHFSSGAFGLLGKLPDGTDVAEPLSAVEALPSEHPYSKIGKQRLSEYAASTPGFFSECGVALHSVPSASSGTGSGTASAGKPTSSVAEPVEATGASSIPSTSSGADDVRNGYRITALGTLKPAWLAMDDVTLLASKDEKIGEKALIVNFTGFLDFNTRFIAEGLEKRGTECRIESVKLDEVEHLRKNPAEMRSVNIARVMNNEANWKQFAHKVQELLNGEDVVVLPEVFGFENPVIMQWLKEMIPARVVFIGTTPPSVPGIRTQRLLKKAFETAGGTFLMGDEALDAVFDGERVASIRTANLGELRIEADTFVLASGNLFGKGLVASPDAVKEPVFGLDVDYPAERKHWYDEKFFARQNYTGFGVKTNGDFQPLRAGKVVPNLYVIGSEVGGCNPLAEGSGAGVSIMTAFSAADSIIGK